MNNVKSHAGTYFWIGLNFIGFSLLAQGWSTYLLYTLGAASFLISVMVFLSPKYKWRWLAKTIERVGSIPVTHLARFLPLILFALALIQAKHVPPGMLVILVAYIMFGWSIGMQLGKGVLQPLLAKCRR